MPLLRQTSVSDRRSVDAIELCAEILAWRRSDAVCFNNRLGLAVRHMTACPCTQVYNRSMARTPEASFPHITHSQRSKTRLCLEDPESAVSYEDLLECLESTLHVTQDLLKRPDEAEIVLRAHRRPQFAEDVVRSVAQEIGRCLPDAIPARQRGPHRVPQPGKHPHPRRPLHAADDPGRDSGRPVGGRVARNGPGSGQAESLAQSGRQVADHAKGFFHGLFPVRVDQTAGGR